jgi:hypothetical protein
MSKKQSILIQTVVVDWLDMKNVILEPKCCFRQEMHDDARVSHDLCEIQQP